MKLLKELQKQIKAHHILAVFAGVAIIYLFYNYSQKKSGSQDGMTSGGRAVTGQALAAVQKGNAQGVNIGSGIQFQFNEQLDGYIDGIFTFTNFDRPNVANRFLFTLGAIYLLE